MDYYRTLGVSKNASQDEIKKAYRKLAMQTHPDRNNGDDSRFKQINEAYDVLKDPQKRNDYDNPQMRFDSQNMNFNQGFGDFQDVFSQMFSQNRRRPPRPKNDDITAFANLNLEEVYHGKNLIIAYKLSSGQQATVDITIPAGAKDGDTVKYDGLGDDRDKRFPRGDLYVKIRVARSKMWRRDGNDLHTTRDVSAFDLILGGELYLKTPEGKHVKIMVPQGAASGTVMSVKGYGIPDVRTGTRGNIFLKLNAHIPKIKDKTILAKLKEIKNEIDPIP